MKQYSVTAKIWVKVEAKSPEEAESKAKNTVDEALYCYVTSKLKHEGITSISKAKVTWVKESQSNEATNTNRQR